VHRRRLLQRHVQRRLRDGLSMSYLPIPRPARAVRTIYGETMHARFAPTHTAPRRLAALLALAALCFATSAFAEDRQPIDDELEKYWNVELAVPTLSNATYARAGAFEAAVGFGVVPNDSYYLPLPLNLKLGYHMTETVALEVTYSYLITPKSDLLNFLENPGTEKSLLDGVVNPPRMSMLAALDLVYSPFHGKVGIFDKKLSSFDVGLVVGVGGIFADVDKGDRADDVVSEFLPAGHWGLALRFFLNRWLNVRADVRQFVYKPGDAALFPVELTFGVAFLTI
jgi:outer membrane beta-barrel protein